MGADLLGEKETASSWVGTTPRLLSKKFVSKRSRRLWTLDLLRLFRRHLMNSFPLSSSHHRSVTLFKATLVSIIGDDTPGVTWCFDHGASCRSGPAWTMWAGIATQGIGMHDRGHLRALLGFGL